MRFPVRAVLIGALFALCFSYVAIVAANRGGPLLPSTQISSVSILFCVALVLLVNPLLRFVRLRVFSRRELFLILIMSIVPAGIPVFGYICEVVPLIGGLHHPEWNTRQGQWNEKVVPHLDPTFFVGAPLFQKRDVRDWRAFCAHLQKSGEDGRPRPAQRMWEMMPGDARRVVGMAAEGRAYTDEQKREALRDVRQRREARGEEGLVPAWQRTLAMRELVRENEARIVRAIENVLQRKEFYDPEAFGELALPAEATALAAKARDRLSEDEVKRLNRYVLEAAFPKQIRSSKFLQDQWALRDYMRGLQARNREAWPVFLKKPEEDWSAFAARLKRYFANEPPLTEEEVKRWWRFYPTLAGAGDESASPGQARVWALMDGRSRALIERVGALISKVNRRDARHSTSLSKGMRAVLKRRDLFRAESWGDRALPARAAALLEKAIERLPTGELAAIDGVDTSSFVDTGSLVQKTAVRRSAVEYLSATELEQFNRSLVREAIPEDLLSDWRKLARHLRAAWKDDGDESVARLRELLPEEVQETVRMAAEAYTLSKVNREKVLAALNSVIVDPQLYAARAFDRSTVDEEANRLLGRGVEALTDTEMQTLNRLLVESAFPRSFHRYTARFFGELPWASWIQPLAGWILLGLVIYLLFFSLNELIFKQWYEREKLVFPIAQISEIVLDTEGDKGGSVLPRVFRSAPFWVGFGISFAILFYNGMIGAHWIEGLSGINLGGSTKPMDAKLRNTVLHGITGSGFRFHVFFTAIGLAFLLPVEISFSVWFFFLFMMAQQLIAVNAGYGVDGNSFRADWVKDTNFMKAQGGGAMQVFGFLYLWRVRRQVVAVLYRLVRPEGTASFSKEEIRDYTVPSILFVAATAGIFYFLRRGNVPWGMAAVTYVALLLMTIAMVRLVAECGIVGFQAWFGPFHVMKMFGLLKYTSLFAVRGIGTAMVLVSGSFLDLKTFVAPTMMNARYLAARQKISRGRFGISVFLAIGITLVMASIVAVVLCYDLGVGSMHGWFFQAFPKGVFGKQANMISNVEGMSTLDPAMVGWFSVGAILCGGMVYLRQFLFWVPHPIGLVLFVSPLADAYWFSFFVGWLCKRAAVRYCDADGYKSVRAFFIGLILGEILAVGFATVIALLGYQRMGIGLNRN